ncbi:hypothetical protein [Agrococcus beijingensis]|uniref:hypothetical protein n=1 Tax=Agrococcus beijingensis TaxID=3068634 RepID=UPI00274036E4|nr:hypothetical protein [Agrococcus sp. REN33]
MADALEDLDDRCERCGALVWDERCRACGYVHDGPPHVDKPDTEALPGIRGW